MDPPPTKKSKATSIVAPIVPKEWDRCHAYMERKGRFCRQEVLPSLSAMGQRYCGNHRHLASLSVSSIAVPQQQEGAVASTSIRKRIVCPIDPSHYIYEDMLEKHVAKCPKTIERQNQQQQDFYCQNCNCGGYGQLNDKNTYSIRTQESKDKQIDNEKEIEWAKRVATMVLKAYQRIFIATRKNPKTIDSETDDIDQITYQDIVDSIPLLDLSQLEFDSGFITAVTDYRIKSGGIRHMHQQASMIGHLRRIGALEPRSSTPDSSTQSDEDITRTRTILEMGAGRGMTGLVVAGVSALTTNVKTHFTMIERSASRSRAEKFLRKVKRYTSSYPPSAITATSKCKYMDLEPIDWTRIHCDLSHVDVKTVLDQNSHNPKAPNNAEEPTSSVVKEELIVIAKHLCGVGTDLALKSIEPIKDDVTVCIMSTCCHGVCSWEDYVGRIYLSQAMVDVGNILSSFGELEFDLLRLWSSATVRDTSTKQSTEINGPKNISDHSDTIDEDHSAEISVQNDTNLKCVNVTKVVEALQLKCSVQGFGRACQRLIDYGRCEYLRHVILNSTGGNSTFRDQDTNINNVEMIYYVPDSISPQNALLVAYR